MAKYQVKATVDAWQWDETAETLRMLEGRGITAVVLASNPTSDQLLIETVQGVKAVSKGDWIIKGKATAGNGFFVCRGDDFEETYEPALTMEEVAMDALTTEVSDRLLDAIMLGSDPYVPNTERDSTGETN